MKTETIENRPFADIVVGDSAELTRTLTHEDMDLFAAASGDYNPTHVDEGYVREHYLGH